MNIDEIDNDIVRQLENNGLKKGDREQRIKLLLTHAYMAIRMYWAMSPEDRVLTSEWHKKFRRSFSLKKFLKEGKRHGERKIPPLHPLYKERPSRKRDENESVCGARVSRFDGKTNGLLDGVGGVYWQVRSSDDSEVFLLLGRGRQADGQDEI